MQFVEGDQFGDEEVGRLPRDRRRDMYYAAVETLARLHVIEPSAVGLETFGPPGNYLERQVRRWIGQYRASQTDILEPAERLIAWLPSAVPRQTARKIVHGDFRFENMIFESGTPRIAAILDWELSTIGDPIADLAFFALNWVTPEDGPGSLCGLDLPRLGIPPLGDILAAYCRSAGIRNLPELDWYFAFNCFRLAAMIAGIKQRFDQGQIDSESVHSTVARIRPLAEAGWHFARRAGA
jgi:aminoglycoside phosphotransferase (APT) family kinase protein